MRGARCDHIRPMVVIRSSPLSTRKLAAELGIDRNTVQRIRQGKRWRPTS